MDQGDRTRHGSWMDETLIGYARCSTDEQDLTAQRQALHALGVPPYRVYIDHGISGTKRERPGLDHALAAVRTGDTLVVPKLDRLARSVPDAREDAPNRRIRDLRSWRAVLGVATDGLPHPQPHKPMGNQSAGLNGVSDGAPVVIAARPSSPLVR